MEKASRGLILPMLVCFLIALPCAAPAEEGDRPGVVQGIGVHFEVTDSEYLNVTVDSSAVIELELESIPEMVAMHLASAAGDASAEIALGGLAPDTTYYKYEDDYHNLATLTTDAGGACAYTQDLTSPHAVFIQPSASTYFIRDDATGGDAKLIGIWDPVTKTCTMTKDVTQTIQIDSDGITLDGNGHSTTGRKSGAGVYIRYHSNITVKNLTIKTYYYGVYVGSAPGCTLEGCTIQSNVFGLSLRSGSEFAVIRGNTATGNASDGFNFTSTSYALVEDNTATYNSYDGVRLYQMTDTEVTGNTLSGNRSAALYVVNSSAISVTQNALSGGKSAVYMRTSGDLTVSHNTISASSIGIYCDECTDSAVFNNSVTGNTRQAYANNSPTTVFHLSLPQGGNYWSDWTSPDADGDDIVDLPYVFDTAQDDLPWVAPDLWPPLGGNTQPGSNVTVEPAEGVSLTFAEITGAGETTVTTSSSPPHGPPTGFRFLDTYFDISTTAGYVAPITIQIEYDPAAIPGNRANHLRIFHSDGSGWSDVTVEVDTENHIITAVVSGLSWFGIGWPEYTFAFLPPVEGRDKPFKRGSTIPLKFSLSELDGSAVPEAVATLTVYYLESGAPTGEAEVVSTAAGDLGNQFRYDAGDDLYIFNLSTKDPSYVGYFTYLAQVALDDGSTHSVEFALK